MKTVWRIPTENLVEAMKKLEIVDGEPSVWECPCGCLNSVVYYRLPDSLLVTFSYVTIKEDVIRFLGMESLQELNVFLEKARDKHPQRSPEGMEDLEAALRTAWKQGLC